MKSDIVAPIVSNLLASWQIKRLSRWFCPVKYSYPPIVCLNV